MNIMTSLLTISLVIFISACGGGGTTNVTAGNALKIYAESSQTSDTTINIEGTWKTACYQQGGDPYQEDIITISATGVFTYIKRSYSVSDATCAGTYTDTRTFPTTLGVDATLSVDVEPRTMLGWKNGNGDDVDAPQRADTTGLLSGNPDISQLDLTEGSNVYSTAYYLDDTAATHVLYREDSGSQASNGYAQYMLTDDPFVKQ